jgi:O-methyltransferase
MLDWVNRNAQVRCWIAEQRGRIPTFEYLDDFYRHVHDEVCGGNAIDFLEFGVCAGRSIEFWSQLNDDPRSRFIGFDSFEGLPEDWTRNFPKGALSTGGWVPEIDDERVSFVKGWFQKTLPGFLTAFAPRSRLVVHSDSDLYSSTLFTLASLNMLLVPGAVVIFDDFSMATHVFRAFADYKAAFMRSAHPVAMTSDYAAQVAFVLD